MTDLIKREDVLKMLEDTFYHTIPLSTRLKDCCLGEIESFTFKFKKYMLNKINQLPSQNHTNSEEQTSKGISAEQHNKLLNADNILCKNCKQIKSKHPCCYDYQTDDGDRYMTFTDMCYKFEPQEEVKA